MTKVTPLLTGLMFTGLLSDPFKEPFKGTRIRNSIGMFRVFVIIVFLMFRGLGYRVLGILRGEGFRV